ncbi:MAG TPA: ferritin-like protein, partial [Dokdonella sp.]
MTDAIAVPTSREQLWGLLAEAAEIEHHLMCCYLYAAFSLKEGTDEDLSDAELAAVRRWRAEIFAVAIEEMGHLATVCNILSSLGAPAHLDHQNFPVSAGYHPAGVVVKLTPFNPQTLAHFIYLERPGDADVADGAGFEPARHYVRDSQMDRLMTVTTEYRTVGRLYESINLGLAGLAATLGESRLFAGDPAHQLGADVGGLPGLKVVRCLVTARAAIDAIVRQGEGAEATEARSHYQRFLSIREEYDRLLVARPGFRPARMSAHNPVMRRPPTPEGKLWITEEPAASLLDLGNALYNHCLLPLARLRRRRRGDAARPRAREHRPDAPAVADRLQARHPARQPGAAAGDRRPQLRDPPIRGGAAVRHRER